MTDEAIQTYLSAALDQEACKKTLTEALESRVIALQKREITATTIITCLKALCDDPFQINDDVIYDVIEGLHLSQKRVTP
ncbi:MAG: hypothetical protein RLP44_11955 [Aggregatilineales bacterium]